MQPDAAMIFAAGFGTRMGALTQNAPKPMLKVAGRPLLDHALDHVTDAGIQRVVVNTHYLAEKVETHLSGREVTVLREEPDILETGGGLRNALPALGKEPVITLNPDALFLGFNPVQALLDAWHPQMQALLLLVPREAALCHAGVGDFDMKGDATLARRNGPSAPFVYTGAQIVRTEKLHDIPETAFSLNRLWDRMFHAGGVNGLVYSGDWIDVGSPDGLATARARAGDRSV